MGGNRTEAGLGGHGDCMDLPERAPRTNTAMSGRHRLTHRGQLGATRRADAASPPPRGELGDGKAKNAAFRDAERAHGRAAHVQDVDRHVGAVVRERRITPGLIRQQLAPLVRTTYWQAQQYGRGVSKSAPGGCTYSRALGVEPRHFIGGVGPGKPDGRPHSSGDRSSGAEFRRAAPATAGGARRAGPRARGKGWTTVGTTPGGSWRPPRAWSARRSPACRAGAELRPGWSRTRRREWPTSWVRP